MDEIDLIERCKRRDFGAFEALYQLYQQRALRTAYLITRSKPAAEDAMQETFIQVWRGIDGLREVGVFRSWFYRILLATARRLDKKDRKMVALPLHLHDYDQADLNALVPAEYLEHEEELRELRTAIAALPDAHRTPLILRYYTRLTDAEIAEAVGTPAGTVKSRLHNARRMVQDVLNTSGAGDREGSASRAEREGHSHD